MMKNQKGIAHILVILILVVGLVVGVYLVGKQTFFKPRAGSGVSSPIIYLPSPIAHWKFDDGSGTTAKNTGTRGAVLDGTLSGVSLPHWTNGGKQDGGLSFNGSSSYLAISDPVNPTAFTISAWVNSNTTTTPANIFVRTDRSGPTAAWSHQIRINSYGKAEAYIWDGSPKTVTGSTVLSPGIWYHIAATAESGGKIRLYVNGREEGTPVLIGTLWSGGSAYYVGSNSGQNMRYFDGVIDEVKLYDSVLTREQIIADMVPGEGIVPTTWISPIPTTIVYPPGDLEQRITQLETQMTQTQQKQDNLQATLDRLIDWIKSVLPGFN